MIAATFNQNPLLAYQGDGINNQGGLLWPFIKNKNVYWCPTDLATNTPGYRARINKMSTYIMSGAVCGFGASMSGYKLTQFRQDAYISWERMNTRPAAARPTTTAPATPTRTRTAPSAAGTGRMVAS